MTTSSRKLLCQVSIYEEVQEEIKVNGAQPHVSRDNNLEQ